MESYVKCHQLVVDEFTNQDSLELQYMVDNEAIKSKIFELDSHGKSMEACFTWGHKEIPKE